MVNVSQDVLEEPITNGAACPAVPGNGYGERKLSPFVVGFLRSSLEDNFYI